MSPAHVPSNGTPAKKPQALQACPTRSGSPPTQPRKGELVVPAVPVRGRCRCRGGRTGGRVKDALFGQICTSRSDFPRSLLFKGANLPKPVHASRPRPTRIPPTPQTHPAHAPSSDAQPYKNPADLRPSPQFPQLAPPKTHNLPIFCTFPTKNKHQRGRVRPSPGIDRRRDLQRRLNSRQVIVFPAIPLSRGTRPHHCEH